jgi:hypothetical protein
MLPHWGNKPVGQSTTSGMVEEDGLTDVLEPIGANDHVYPSSFQKFIACPIYELSSYLKSVSTSKVLIYRLTT